MTYSIIARDEASGQMAVAVQTCHLAVGAWVPWGEGGTGVIATQAYTNRLFGPAGLELLAKGYSAEQALAALLATDDEPERRQVALMDSSGGIATHTGAGCLDAAGHVSGTNFSAQANMVDNERVWRSLAETFANGQGKPFGERLLDGLDAAEAAGGDIRGKQTAALIIVSPERSALPLLNLRVDHHPEPLAELRRLYNIDRAYNLLREAYEALESDDDTDIRAKFDEVAELAPDEGYLHYVRGRLLVEHLQDDEGGMAVLRELLDAQPQWWEYMRRVAASEDGIVRQLYDRLSENQ